MIQVDADLAHINDPRLVAKIMGKRQAEAERKARFYNVKQRMIGLDKEYLDGQVEAKKAATQVEQALDFEYAANAQVYDQVAMMADAQKESSKKAMAADCKAFSQQFLRKEFRREFHLSDPEALKNEQNPDRDNAGPASMLKFRGEQIAIDKRNNKKIYENLQLTWIQEQMEEKQLREQEEKELNRYQDDTLVAANQLRGAIEVTAEQVGREAKRQEAQANLQLAEEKRMQKAALKRRDEMWERQHVQTVLESPMLQESIGVGYKGVGAAQKQAVYDENALQVLDKRKQQEAEWMENAASDRNRLQATAVMGTIEMHKNEVEREKRRLLNMENDIIAKAQRDMRLQVNKTYANQVGEDYFNKFNTTAR